MPEIESTLFEIKFLNSQEKIPSPQDVSAVFLIALRKGNIVAIRNHRGWDLPAGHIEEGEGVFEALQREVREEASMSFENSIPFVMVVSNSQDPKYQGKCMIGFATKEFVFDDFITAPDSEERKIMPIEEFLSRYEQDKITMRLMIEKAVNVLGQNE